MCGCNSNNASRSSSSQKFAPQHERNAAKAIEICKHPIEYYLGMDTSSWEPNHRALVRSQINVYYRKCDQFHDTIESLQEFYSSSLRNEAL